MWAAGNHPDPRRAILLDWAVGVPSAISVDDGERWTGEEPSKLLLPLSDPPVMRLRDFRPLLSMRHGQAKQRQHQCGAMRMGTQHLWLPLRCLSPQTAARPLPLPCP